MPRNRPAPRAADARLRSPRPSALEADPMSTENSPVLPSAPAQAAPDTSPRMKEIREAILAGTAGPDPLDPAQIAALPLPESYRAVTVHADEVGMFEGQ